MRRIAFIFTALMLLASCSKGYKVTVTLPDGSNNGETVFLTNYDTGDTIATAMVENNMCTLEGMPTVDSLPACMWAATLTDLSSNLAR